MTSRPVSWTWWGVPVSAMLVVGGLACDTPETPRVRAPSPDDRPESGPSAPATPSEVEAPSQVAAAPSDDDFAEQYLTWRSTFESEEALGAERRSTMFGELRRIANEARDVHLRANAALLLGAAHDREGDLPVAEGFYRLATSLVSDDAGPAMALALALAKQGKFAEAAEVQARVTDLDPDNLENWLLLGELRIKAGDEPGGTAAYVDYERRRKGLIDGLTLTSKAGDHLVSAQERIGCAEALASATDQGTAIALAYALQRDPSVEVRAAVARVMGVQRLGWYRGPLEAAIDHESGSPEVREAVAWALAEVVRDPVDVSSGR